MKTVMRNTIYIMYVSLAAAMLASCTSEDMVSEKADGAEKALLTIDVRHPSATRATATAFEEGDQIGLYVHESQLPLEMSGNLINNEPITLTGGIWMPRNNLYWSDGTFNACAYYPYMEISSVEDQPFSVSTDQTTTGTAGHPGGYEASDLLYACTKGVKASSSPIPLNFRHSMSRLTIRLVKGEDFEGEMPKDAQVFIHNTVTSATVDLSAGVVTRNPKGTTNTIKARQEGNYIYAAIVVPQRLPNRVPFIEVVMKGISYLYESKFQFKPGVNHLVNFIISRNPEQVSINIAGDLDDWQ